MANPAVCSSKVYLAFALRLVPLNAKIQDDIIPLVLPPIRRTLQFK